MNIFPKSTFLHLRIPFSFFLMPVYFFALSQNTAGWNWIDALLIFLILHLFLYPASNGYNSYFDKDKESIGGLENPPPVSKNLYFTSLVLDGVAIALGLMVGLGFAAMLMIYGLVSKAYSHPIVRLKKYTYLSWITIGVFQGYFTFMMVETGLSGVEAFKDLRMNLAGLLSSLLLLGSYPMTQIYQHKEDQERGDITLSLKLGINGTFIFTALVFTIATLSYAVFFSKYYEVSIAIAFIVSLSPVLVYFMLWFFRVLKNECNADFRSTMRLNFISSVCMNAFFIFLIIYSFW